MSKKLLNWQALWCCVSPLLVSGAAPLKAQVQQQAPVQTPVQRDVVYGEADGQKLLLDVYGAAPGAARPAVIVIHGGSWTTGSKADLGFVAALLARQGYVGFSVNYRLLRDGKNRFPAQMDDVQRAVRWVRAHADEYGVDPARIGALGASAGGHLAALLGTSDTRDNSDAALAAYSSRVQAVVDLYGPSDFTPALEAANAAQMAGNASPGAQILRDFLGDLPAAAPNYRAASPLTRIDKQTAPFLLFHGAKDTLVPLDQSQRLDAALRAAGIESKLVVFPNAGHGYREPELLSQTFSGALEFFGRHLKSAPVKSAPVVAPATLK